MARYMETARKAGDYKARATNEILEMVQRDTGFKGDISKELIERLLEYGLRMMNYGIRCSPRGVQSKVRLNAIKEAGKDSGLKISMTDVQSKRRDGTPYTFKALTINGEQGEAE